METQLSTPSWWKKPEGKTGKWALIAGIAAAGYLFVTHIDQIIKLLENTLYAGILAGAIFIIVVTLADKRFRSSLWYLYKSIMRGITSIFVQLNPIAILKGYIEDLQAKMIKIEEQLDLLKGQIGKIGRKIEDRKTECAKELQLAEIAKKKGNIPAEVELHARQAKRLQDFVDKLQKLYNKMQLLYKILDKMRYYSDIMVKNTTFEVQIKEDEYESIRKSHNVMKTAFSIIKGDNDKKVIFDEAMDFITNDIGTKVGEMERMMDASTDFINSVDLENAAYSEDGMKLLESFEQKGLETIFGTTNSDGTTNTGTGSASFDSAVAEMKIGDSKPSKYNGLI